MFRGSLLNEIIGPVMRGPSSSHTAAPHAIGRACRHLVTDGDRTIVEAIVLVVIVMFVFLQSWRATLIPIVTTGAVLVMEAVRTGPIRRRPANIRTRPPKVPRTPASANQATAAASHCGGRPRSEEIGRAHV